MQNSQTNNQTNRLTLISVGFLKFCMNLYGIWYMVYDIANVGKIGNFWNIGKIRRMEKIGKLRKLGKFGT